jgi:hypothetical protein
MVSYRVRAISSEARRIIGGSVACESRRSVGEDRMDGGMVRDSGHRRGMDEHVDRSPRVAFVQRA